MSVDLKKRFDRIVNILIQLQSKRVIRAQELADRFEVSLRTIYRDIKSLEQAGVPIIGESGTGYSIVEGYKLPPIVFSKEEALSFIGAEKLMEKYMDGNLISNYKSAIYKIKSVLKYSEKNLVSALEDQIQLSNPHYEFFNKKVPHALSTFFNSIASKKQVNIQYKGVNDEQPQIRTLEPIGLHHENGFWYIAAFCILRNDYRQFRADRISTISLTEKDFSDERMSLELFLQKRNNVTPKTQIIISTNPRRALQFHWERQHFGFVEEVIGENNVQMLFEFNGSIEYFARWFMMFSDEAEIIEPQSLKSLVKKILTDSLNHMK